MKKIHVVLGTFLFLMVSVISANATQITTSASGNFFGDTYSYTFTISDTSDLNVYSATLTNTSTASLSDALIDLLAFNMNADLGTDFSIINVNPNWDFYAGSGGIQFDYVGERDQPSDRLGPSDTLTFNFLFDSEFTFPIDPFSLWTGTSQSLGGGIGGGEDSGQVAVSFQQLGSSGNDSDLLASNWGSTSVPDASVMLLLGSSFLGFAVFSRKRKES